MGIGRIQLSFQPLELLSLVAILSLPNRVLAGPYPKDDLHDTGFSYLIDRSCVTYCGAQNQYCCGAGEACYTNVANIAYCSWNSGDTGGGYAVYTTTYTETNLVLRTSTYTSSWAIETSTLQPAIPHVVTQQPVCTSSLGESSCGSICCAQDQRCAFLNSCTAHTATSIESTTCTTFSAPFRPTSGDFLTRSATTTIPFQPPATASGSVFPVVSTGDNAGLSGGAIAGIVIGVILGVAILLLLCSCCILKPRRRRSSVGAGSNINSSRPEKSSYKNKLLIGGGLLMTINGLLGLRKERRAAPSRAPSSRAASGRSSPCDSISSETDTDYQPSVGRSPYGQGVEGDRTVTRETHTYREQVT